MNLALSAYLGKDDRSRSRYSPKAFWIFPSRSANRSRDRCTPCMFRTSITSGDLETFFIRAKNSVLILENKGELVSLCRGSSALPVPDPAGAVPLEALGFHGQQMFDVRTACEDALQVDPAPLHINPHVEEGHDPVQLVFPAQGIFFKHLVGTQEGRTQPFPPRTCQR